MSGFEQFSSYGALGVMVAVLLAWTGRDRLRLERRLDRESEYVKGMLRSLLEDCLLEMSRTRRAIESAPCGDGATGGGFKAHARIVPRDDDAV